MTFLSGDTFENYCKYILNENRIDLYEPILKLNLNGYDDWYYVKTDFLEKFINQYKPIKPYYLITGKSDYSIDKQKFEMVEDCLLKKWYGINITYKHPKLQSIPLGINNAWYKTVYNKDYGDHSLLEKIINENNSKNNFLYANFNIENNIIERKKCLVSTGVKLCGCGLNSSPYETYLRELSQSYFCVAPDGNGIDTHRLWEALYVKTIPIVTRTINSCFYEGKLPIIFLNSWEEYNSNLIDISIYEKMMKNFNFTKYNISNFLK